MKATTGSTYSFASLMPTTRMKSFRRGLYAQSYPKEGVDGIDHLMQSTSYSNPSDEKSMRTDEERLQHCIALSGRSLVLALDRYRTYPNVKDIRFLRLAVHERADLGDAIQILTEYPILDDRLVQIEDRLAQQSNRRSPVEALVMDPGELGLYFQLSDRIRQCNQQCKKAAFDLTLSIISNQIARDIFLAKLRQHIDSVDAYAETEDAMNTLAQFTGTYRHWVSPEVTSVIDYIVSIKSVGYRA